MQIKSYAKVNLALDVVGKREDGYHLVETVMQRVELCDKIDIRWAAGGEDETSELKIEISSNRRFLPTGPKNLAYRAAQIMAEASDRPRIGTLYIDIEKRIPVAAGLGGGSSNAAVVMIALNRIWKLGFDTKKLCELGTPLGADIPFLILMQNTRFGCALATGIGEVLHPIRRGMRKYIVLAKPSFGVSTKEVFAGIDGCGIESHPDIDGLCQALKTGDEEKVYDCMGNVLEEYTCKQYKDVEVLKEELSKTDGVRKVMMSGSGPTVMAIYDRPSCARRAGKLLREAGYEAYWTQTMREIGGKRNAEF